MNTSHTPVNTYCGRSQKMDMGKDSCTDDGRDDEDDEDDDRDDDEKEEKEDEEMEEEGDEFKDCATRRRCISTTAATMMDTVEMTCPTPILCNKVKPLSSVVKRRTKGTKNLS
jgi:hypothetical protein